MVADFIQPGLVQLQPNLEDFMDTLEPFQGIASFLLLETLLAFSLNCRFCKYEISPCCTRRN